MRYLLTELRKIYKAKKGKILQRTFFEKMGPKIVEIQYELERKKLQSARTKLNHRIIFGCIEADIELNDIFHLMYINNDEYIKEAYRKKLEKGVSSRLNREAFDILETLAIYNGFFRLALQYRYARENRFENNHADSLVTIEQKYIAKKGNWLLPQDQLYGEYLNGKKVAILGPLIDLTEMNRIRNENDIIIMITYNNRTNYDIKINVSYYNGENADLIELMEDKSFLESLSFVCWKSQNYSFQRGSNSRKIIYDSLEPILSVGSPNMFQHVLWDLLHFEPISISAYGFNLMCSRAAHNYEYGIEEHKCLAEQERRQRCYSLGVHNLISQYLFTKKLYDDGYFKMDEMGKEVMNMGIDEYVKKMEEIYGDFH